MADRIPLVVYNERVKLLANISTAIGGAFAVFAVVRPLASDEGAIDGLTLYRGAAALIFWVIAYFVLGALKEAD